MAENVNRTVTLGVDSEQVQGAINRLKQSGTELYGELKTKAENYSSKLSEQSQKVDTLIRKESEYLKTLAEEKRVAIELSTQARMSAIDPAIVGAEERRNQILEERKRLLDDINQEYRENKVVIQQAKEEADDEYGDVSAERGRGGAGGAVGSIATALATGAGIGAVIAGIPMVGKILSTIISASEELQQNQRQLFAQTGREATTGGANVFGINTADFTTIQRQVAITRGRAGAGLEGDVLGQIGAERGFGLDVGQLTPLAQFARQGADDPAALLQDVLARAQRSDIWSISQGDFSDLGEKMSFIGSLMEREREISENLTQGRSAAILESFGKMGGSYADNRALGRINSLDQAIRSGGGNEFMQAEVMSAIAGEDPSLSLFQVRQKQAQGVFGEGNLAAILTRAQAQHGVGTEMTQAFLAALSKDLMDNPEALAKLAGVDPSLFRFDPGMSEEDRTAHMQELLDKAGFTADQITQLRGGGATSPIQQIDAAMTDAIARMGDKMVDAIESPLKDFSEGLIDFAQDPAAFVKDMWADTIDSIENSMTKTWDGVTLSVKQTFEEIKMDIKDFFKNLSPFNGGGVGNNVPRGGKSPQEALISGKI